MPGSGSAPAQVDVDSILAEVQSMQGVVDSSPSPAPTGLGGLDFSALERDIEALLAGNGSGSAAIAGSTASTPATPNAPTPTTPTPSPAATTPPPAPSLRDACIEATTMDPLIAEIEQTLADDAHAMLERSGGDIDAALGEVLGAKAFASQEDDIQRAMIESRGSSRVPQPSFAAPITHPAPRFEGTARGVQGATVPSAAPAAAPGNPVASVVAARVELDPAPTGATSATAGVAKQYDGEKPIETAFPTIPAAKAETLAERVHLAAEAAGVAAPAPKPTADAIPEPSEPVAPKGPGFFARMLACVGSFLRRAIDAPALVFSLPMRVVPGNARAIVGIAAITMVLWVPVAWWMAYSKSRSEGVGPVELVVREPAAPAEGEAKEATSSDAASSADASHGAPASH